MSTYAIDSDAAGDGGDRDCAAGLRVDRDRRRVGAARRRSRTRDEDTGMPLWQVEVSYRTESFGRETTVNAMVTVGAPEQPKPGAFTHITFDVLRVNVHVNKAGGISERWAAESVKHLTPENARPRAVEPEGG